MSTNNKFGTFAGVFTPTAITILGVIMYLRHGWVVGNAGLLGAWLIIIIAIGISGATALSLSSISTNTRLHAGGAYGIISRSLGIEAGSSIGIALYLAQTLAVTMYIFGFREGWLSIFPEHPELLIDLLAFGGVLGITLISSTLAAKVQYFVLAITALSLVCIAFGPWREAPAPIEWWGSYQATGGGYDGFWIVFSVFFPAVTGVMAGANMSGELINPKRSIPKGTLSAVVLCSVVYFWLAYLLARVAPSKDLIANTNIMVEQSWSPLFMEFSILCATSSSALATLVGSPRILQALAEDQAIPGSKWLAQRSEDGEPRNAIYITGAISLVALSLRDLNAIAPLITIFFLTTYGAINGVVLIEQGLGLVSFRPRLRIPIWIPTIGAFGAFLAMLIINPELSVLAISSLFLAYAVFSRRQVHVQHGDVRSNIFIAIARWLTREARSLPQSDARAWIPALLCPILDKKDHKHSLELALDISTPRGSVTLLHIVDENDHSTDHEIEATARFKTVHFKTTTLRTNAPQQALTTALQVLRHETFRPNILSLGLDDGYSPEHLNTLLREAQNQKMGVVLRSPDDREIGEGGIISVWIRPQKESWSIRVAQEQGALDLSLLVAIRLAQRHKMRICLITTITNTEERKPAEQYLSDLIDVARLPRRTETQALQIDFWTALQQQKGSAVHIFGLPSPYKPLFIKEVLEQSSSACLFIQSSGHESIVV
ncbi:MAG: Na-K-Cl cotransporter [Proteobacteria bacterium]|nr:Na-K-Cl cotransporter [Pseudomonadota bacterium]